MHFIKSKVGLWLSGALLVASAQGCQGEETVAPVASAAPLGVSAQEINCGASLVPAMTSASLPGGAVTRSGAFSSSYEAWQALDASETTMWISQQGQTPAWVAYEWPDGAKPVTHYAIKYSNGSITQRAPKNWTLEGWNGSTWVVVDTRTNQTAWGGSERREFTVTSPGSFSRYRLHVTDDNASATGIDVISIGKLELLNCGCTPTSQIPAMTSATLPGGSVTRSSVYAGDPAYEAWQAFDSSESSMWISNGGLNPEWVAYEWADGPRKIYQYAIRYSNGSLLARAPKNWTLEGWNGTAWVVVDTRTNQTGWTGFERREYSVATPGFFGRYRLNVTDDNDPNAGIDVISIGKLDLIGCATDTQPPAAPVLTGFTPASPSNSTQPTLNGTAEAASTVRIFSGAACAGTPLATVTASSTGAFSSVRTVPANTTASFTATATDAAGNVSVCSLAISYQHDGVAPAAPSLTGFSPASPSNNASPTLSGTAEAGSTVRIFSGTACGGTALASVVASSTGTFSSVRPMVTNTTNTFTANTTDVAGNVSVCSASISYRHDSVVPAAPVLTGFSPASPSNNVQPTLSGTAEPGSTVRLFSGTACSGTILTTAVALSSGAFSIVRTVAANTTSTFTASTVDAAGNVSACSSSISYRHDGQPPAAPSLTGFTPASPGTSLSPQLRGTAERSATVQVFAGSGCTGTVLSAVTADASTGAFTTSVNVNPNTATAFSARAVDAVGNASTCSAALTYVHDNIVPLAPVFTEGLIPFDSAPIVGLVRAQTEPRARVSLFSDVACTVAATPSIQAQADATGLVLVPLTQAQADSTVFAVAVDGAGNRSSCVSFEAGCPMGFEDCDGDPANGCEADLMKDEANCGTCGTTCGGAPSANGVCGAGTCGLGCVVGTFDCDGDAANGCESATACDAAVCSVDQHEELLITALSVVEDPARTTGNGVWTFGTLLRRMNGGMDPSELVRNWLRTWEQPQVIEASFVDPRPNIRGMVLGPWEQRSGGASAPLDFNTAPFRLLAIVNRMDLRREGVHAGEGRFVFGVTTPGGGPLPFTVILEYTLPGGSPEEFQRWARDWHELGRLGVGHPGFNAKLQALTDRFSGSFVDSSRFFGSPISQVRTNENALDPLWELREFHFGLQGLAPAPVALTPGLHHNGTFLLTDYVMQNLPLILTETHEVPVLFQGEPFLWGSALTFPNFAWDAQGMDPQARHKFSINTCNGCHAGETRTNFLHVGTRGPGQQAFLSPFLVSGAPTPDPFTGAPRVFNDLGRRTEDLKALVCGTPSQVAVTKDRVGESLLAPARLDSSRAAPVPGFPARSNLPAGRVH